MNWEKSNALTHLKREFLKSFFAKEKRFFLTGGSALGLFYLNHRFSYDLDLFTVEHIEWVEVDGVVRMCADGMGVEVEMLRDSPTFRRYRISKDTETEIIDIVIDVSPQLDTDKPWVDDIRIDTLHEIMLNKITTLISRCEVKDIVDLFFLEKEGWDIEANFEDAKRKDGGLDPAMISKLLDAVVIHELPEYLIKPLSLEELRSYIQDLQKRMALLAYPDEKNTGDLK